MRNVILVGCGVSLIVWLLIITYLYDSDPCKGKVYTAYLVRLQSTCTLKSLGKLSWKDNSKIYNKKSKKRIGELCKLFASSTQV